MAAPLHGRLLPAARQTRVRDLLADVGRVTGRLDLGDPDAALDYAAANRVLLAAWEATLDALARSSPVDTGPIDIGPIDIGAVVTLLRGIRSLDDAIRDDRLRQALEGTVDLPAAIGEDGLAGRGEPALTRREVDVLCRLAEGDTNARIAHRLLVSEDTVKSHVKHILRKLGAANRAEAAERWSEGRPAD